MRDLAYRLYDYLRAHPGMTRAEICRDLGLPGSRASLNSILLSCERAGLLLWEGEVSTGQKLGGAHPEIGYFVMERYE